MEELWPTEESSKAKPKPSSLDTNSLVFNSNSTKGFEGQQQKNKFGIAEMEASTFEQPRLSHDRGEYERLLAKHSKANVHDTGYHQSAVELVKEAKFDILNAAKSFNVPAEAVTACMLDENTAIKRRRPSDYLQDKAFKNNFNNYYRTYQEMENDLQNNRTSQTKRSAVNSYTWDLGPYNINITVAHGLFKQYVLNPNAPDNPIRKLTSQGLPINANAEMQWQNFLNNCLFSEKGGAYLTAAVLQNERNVLASYMRGLSKEEEAAVLVTAFKQGGSNMKQRFLENRKHNPNPADPIKPGEGLLMFHNMGTIQNMLYGEGWEKRNFRAYFR